MSNNIQIHVTVPEDLSAEISRIADRDKRSFSQTVALLLQSAVKERNRKKKNSQVSDNPAD